MSVLRWDILQCVQMMKGLAFIKFLELLCISKPQKIRMHRWTSTTSSTTIHIYYLLEHHGKIYCTILLQKPDLHLLLTLLKSDFPFP